MSDAFSAMANTAAMVLAEVMSAMIDASTTHHHHVRAVDFGAGLPVRIGDGGLGRVGGARANQDFPRRLHALEDTAAAHVPDRLGTPALEFNRHDLRPGTYLEIAVLPGPAQISLGCADPPTPVDDALKIACRSQPRGPGCRRGR